MLGPLRDVASRQPDPAFIDQKRSGNRVQQRGFPRPVRTDDDDPGISGEFERLMEYNAVVTRMPESSELILKRVCRADARQAASGKQTAHRGRRTRLAMAPIGDRQDRREKREQRETHGQTLHRSPHPDLANQRITLAQTPCLFCEASEYRSIREVEKESKLGLRRLSGSRLAGGFAMIRPDRPSVMLLSGTGSRPRPRILPWQRWTTAARSFPSRSLDTSHGGHRL